MAAWLRVIVDDAVTAELGDTVCDADIDCESVWVALAVVACEGLQVCDNEPG